jgi:hypothetical protein
VLPANLKRYLEVDLQSLALAKKRVAVGVEVKVVGLRVHVNISRASSRVAYNKVFRAIQVIKYLQRVLVVELY